MRIISNLIHYYHAKNQMSEATIERTVCAFAKANGVSTLKLSGTSDRGKADRLFMRNGKTIFIEFKAKGKKPTKLQERFLNERKADGFFAEYADDIDDAKMMIEIQLL